MSERAWGWVGVVSGVGLLGIGGWIAFVGTFSVGVGLVLAGVFAGGAGIAVLTEPWTEEDHDRDIVAWERRWYGRWLPECPVHGERLCNVRTDRCPTARNRVP